MHICILIIIPESIYSDFDLVYEYIEEIMKLYSADCRHNGDIHPSIKKNISEIETEYEEHCLKYHTEYYKFRNFFKIFSNIWGSREDQVVEYPRCWFDCDTFKKYVKLNYETIKKNGKIIEIYDGTCIWDSYVIGGRYHGFFGQHDKIVDDPHQIGKNSLSIKEYIHRLNEDDDTNKTLYIIDKEGNMNDWDIDLLIECEDDHVVAIDIHR